VQLRPHSRLAAITALVAFSLTALAVAPRPVVTAAEAVRDLAVATPESVGMSSERLKRLDAAMKKLVDSGKLAGAVTMLTRHGKTVHVTVNGKKDIRKPDPIERDTIFRIYSMTKPVTGVAMMMLFEEGLWRLDDPVSKFVPEFAKLQVYVGENPDGTMKTEPARRSITMRELMTHTGGLGYGLSATNPVDRMFRTANLALGFKPLQEMVDTVAKIPLLAQPGTRWSYSIAVDVQGYIIEKLTGMSLGDFMKARIFDPLGMKDTGFYVPKEKAARLAQVHGEDAGKLTPPDESRGDPTVPPAGASGGGGLFSTAADYARFTEMLLGGGQFGKTRLLAPRTVEMMRTNHVLPDPLKTMRAGTGWGLDFSVMIDSAIAGEPVSNGTFWWWGIAGTWFWIDPVSDLSFIGMIQHQAPTFRTVTDLHSLSRNWVYQAVIQ
jgi:CubicO group peptidase (beta-lactamase class C family)